MQIHGNSRRKVVSTNNATATVKFNGHLSRSAWSKLLSSYLPFHHPRRLHHRKAKGQTASSGREERLVTAAGVRSRPGQPQAPTLRPILGILQQPLPARIQPPTPLAPDFLSPVLTN